MMPGAGAVACVLGMTAAPFSTTSMMCIGLVDQGDGGQRLAVSLGLLGLLLHLGIDPEQAATAVG